MKKALLLGLVLGFGSLVVAQSTVTLKPNQRQHKAIEKMKIGIEPVKTSSVVSSQQIEAPAFLPTQKNTNIVSIIDLGSSVNAYSYGYGGGQKAILHAEPELNVVTNFHRMGGVQDPGGYSGDLGYDISTDGGLTWTNMVEIYVAENNAGGSYYTDAARYPNHGIFNPEGNTDLNNAWLQFFAPNLDGSNSPESWGGYSYGTVNIADPSIRTKNLQSSTPPTTYQYIPDSYEITRQGKVFVVDVNQDWSSGTVVYQGSLIVNKGVFDADLNDFVFTQELIDAPVAAAVTRPSHPQVAFSEDGMTGYISFLGDNETVEMISGSPSYYPIILKTTDGGESWSAPQGIQMGGPNGIAGIVNDLLTDEQIALLFEEPLPARDQISYTTAFDQNIAVDADGNLHIAVVVGATGSDPYSISSGEFLMAAYDIFTKDGGATWHGVKLGSIRQLRGTWPGDYTEDNRIQITLSPDRETVFISWIDTDLADVADNTRPNIFSRGIRTNAWGTADLTCVGTDPVPTNVTLFSVGMWNATFATVAQKSLFADGKYTIPMTYQPLAADVDPGTPVVYKYITNFFFTDADFCVVGNQELPAAKGLEVGQNFPNPVVDGSTNIRVSLSKGSSVDVTVYTLTGQKVLQVNQGYRTAGQHNLALNIADLNTGVYFYTVEADGVKVTKRMIVK